MCCWFHHSISNYDIVFFIVIVTDIYIMFSFKGAFCILVVDALCILTSGMFFIR